MRFYFVLDEPNGLKRNSSSSTAPSEAFISSSQPWLSNLLFYFLSHTREALSTSVPGPIIDKHFWTIVSGRAPVRQRAFWLCLKREGAELTFQLACFSWEFTSFSGIITSWVNPHVLPSLKVILRFHPCLTLQPHSPLLYSELPDIPHKNCIRCTFYMASKIKWLLRWGCMMSTLAPQMIPRSPAVVDP